MKWNCPERAKEKDNKQKDVEDVDNKRAVVMGGSYTSC